MLKSLRRLLAEQIRLLEQAVLVTKDIPANVIAVGAPCRVIRSLDEETIKKLEQK